MKRRAFITLLGGAMLAAARGVRPSPPTACAGSAPCWPSRERSRRTGARGGIPARIGGVGLGRRQQPRDRLSLGGRQTPTACAHHAAELVALQAGRDPCQRQRALALLQKATHTIPIVFAQVTDPVGAGFVQSLARPGGNITGFTQQEFSIGSEMAGIAQADRAACHARGGVVRSGNPATAGYLRAIEAAAPAFGVEVCRSRCATRAKSSAPSTRSRPSRTAA